MSTSRDPARSPVAGLIVGCEAGHYTLPPSLLQAHAAAAAVAQVSLELAERAPVLSPAAIAEDLGADLVGVLAAGGDALPSEWLSRLDEAESEDRRRRFAQNVLHFADEAAWRKVIRIAQEEADSIIADHLAVAFQAAMSEVRKAAGRLDGLRVDDIEGRLRASKTHADAALRIDDMAARFSALTEARRRVWSIAGGPTQDTDGLLDVVRNMTDEAVWPGWRGRFQTNERPWPQHLGAYVVWLATAPRVAWLPTPDEQDAEWLEATKDARRDAQAMRATLARA